MILGLRRRCLSLRCFLFASIGIAVALTTLVQTSDLAWSQDGRGLIDQQQLDGAIPNVKKERPKTFTNPAIIQFRGPIDRKLFLYFNARVAQAKADGVDLLIIEIDSPGGLKNESLEMAETLRDITWAYTVAFIPNEAISGGALVALGVDEMVISPNARFGDIGVIQFDPETWAFRFVESKIESVLSRQARDLCSAKGRPADLGEALVDKEVLVYSRPKDGGGYDFKSLRVEEAKLNPPEAPWTLVEESGPERFLTLSGSRCKALGMADANAKTRSDLAEEIGFSLNQTKVFQYGFADSLVYYLNLPLLTGLLVIVGLVALYFELSAPGMGVGGLIAGLCAALFFWSRFLGGTSGWLEVVLFLAGVIFIAVELFVIPGWGLAGILGVVLMFSSVVMASQDFVMPTNTKEWNTTLTTLVVMLCSMVIFFISALFITRKFGALPMFRRMVLDPAIVNAKNDEGAKADSSKPAQPVHPEISVGDWGSAESLLRPAGRAMFNRRSYDVVSDGSFIEQGTQVRIIRIKGNIITVEAVNEES